MAERVGMGLRRKDKLTNLIDVNSVELDRQRRGLRRGRNRDEVSCGGSDAGSRSRVDANSLCRRHSWNDDFGKCSFFEPDENNAICPRQQFTAAFCRHRGSLGNPSGRFCAYRKLLSAEFGRDVRFRLGSGRCAGKR